VNLLQITPNKVSIHQDPTRITNEAFMVLGSHGGSVARVGYALQRMGVRMGEHLNPELPCSDDFIFFERLAISCLNADLFQHMGGSWDAFRQPSENELDGLLSTEFLCRAQSIVRDISSKPGHWGICDPSCARLLLFWQAVFAKEAIEPRFVLVISDPREAIVSLSKSHRWQREKSLSLWLSHILSVLSLHVDDLVLVDDAKLKCRTDQCIPYIADILGLEIEDQILHRSDSYPCTQAQDVSEPNISDQKDNDPMLRFCCEIYETLQRCERNREPTYILKNGETLGQWLLAFDRLRPLLSQLDAFAEQARRLKHTSHWLRVDRTLLRQSLDSCEKRTEEIEQLRAHIEDLVASKEKQAQAISDLQNELEWQRHQTVSQDELIKALLNSHSWRLTSPLRRIRHLFSSLLS